MEETGKGRMKYEWIFSRRNLRNINAEFLYILFYFRTRFKLILVFIIFSISFFFWKKGIKTFSPLVQIQKWGGARCVWNGKQENTLTDSSVFSKVKILRLCASCAPRRGKTWPLFIKNLFRIYFVHIYIYTYLYFINFRNFKNSFWIEEID